MTEDNQPRHKKKKMNIKTIRNQMKSNQK